MTDYRSLSHGTYGAKGGSRYALEHRMEDKDRNAVLENVLDIGQARTRNPCHDAKIRSKEWARLLIRVPSTK